MLIKRAKIWLLDPPDKLHIQAEGDCIRWWHGVFKHFLFQTAFHTMVCISKRADAIQNAGRIRHKASHCDSLYAKLKTCLSDQAGWLAFLWKVFVLASCLSSIHCYSTLFYVLAIFLCRKSSDLANVVSLNQSKWKFKCCEYSGQQHREIQLNIFSPSAEVILLYQDKR